jgi:DNA-binding CsgD family transcriptional regulator
VTLVPVRVVVGRQAELASIDDFLARMREGPRALFVEGEAGIGKSSLWKVGLDRAAEAGARVLSTRPGGAEVKLAFAGVADLLDGSISSLLPDLPPPQRRAIEVALLLEEPEGTVADDRAAAAGFLSCLRKLAAEAPVLVAVDDAQWLDAASARVLAFACRRLETEPVGILATVRLAAEEAEPVELDAAFGSDRGSHLPVGPLTVAAVYELVRAHLDVALTRPALLRIHEASGGNPFFALELARPFAGRGAEAAADEPLRVPANLRQLVRRRLASLSRPASETLRLAAGLSRPTVSTVELAVASAARAERDLELAARAGLVELRGDEIRFTHPLLASIHFDSAAPGTRRAVHRRLATVVVDPEERARHLALGADRPDAGIASVLEAASERAQARGAIAAGAELAEQALALTPPALADDARRRLLAAAERRYAAGNTARAVELLEAALATAPRRRARAELLWTLGKITFEGQDTRIGLGHWKLALHEVDGDDLLRARILESLTFAAFKQEGMDAARAYAHEAAALAERLGDVPTLARALSQLAGLELGRGASFDLEPFERAVALEKHVGGLELDYGPTAQLAIALIEAGQFERARPLLEGLCARGRASGDAAVHQPLVNLASLEFDAGNWERADELAREAYDVAIQTGREAAEPKGMFTLALIEAARGRCESARGLAERALVLTDGRGWSSGGPRGALGFLELSLENYEAAYDVLLPAIERYRSLGVPVIGQTFDAAEALAALGRVEEARELLGRCKETPALMRVPVTVATAARARGLVAEADGDLAGAETALAEAVQVGERCNRPLELARSLLALGTVQRRLRKKQAARLSLGRAVEIFSGLEAVLWTERARRELARIGGRSAPRGELSATEAEIVELVILGRSNKEVAEALHLSAKTVEWNLSRIYARLGVHSRTELAAARSAERV